jgi:hypothetical protein
MDHPGRELRRINRLAVRADSAGGQPDASTPQKSQAEEAFR